MKEYVKPKIGQIDIKVEDILLVSTNDGTLDYEGAFEEIW